MSAFIKSSIILLIHSSKRITMNFLNFLTAGASLLNFNLQNLTTGFGFGPSPVELTTSKVLSPEHIIKEPPISLDKHRPEPEQMEKERPDDLNKQTRVELFTKQQQLINQYMHLNIQLLSKKLQNLQQIDKLPKQEESDHLNETKSSKKKIKKVNNCGHNDREHYAKGMCSNCYHKYGRNKKPWNCPHNKLYANGMCQNCYINSYNKKRREERAEERHDDAGIEGQSELKVEEEQ